MTKILALLALCCAGVAWAQFDWPPPTYERTAVGDSIDVATLKVLKAAYEKSDDKNIVTSPLGVMIVLSLYEVGAGSGAKAEISTFLGEDNYKNESYSMRELSSRFAGMNLGYLTAANKVAVSDKFTLDRNFASVARDYRVDVDSLDFSKPAEAAAVINRWAAEKTQGHITEPVSQDTLTSDVAVALFNIIYFSGHWHVPFKAEQTKEKDFHVSRDNVVKKPMMHLLQSLYYTESEELGAKLIELPYKERGFRMVVVLPNEVDGLQSVLDKAADKGILTDVFKLTGAGQEVDLDMPKFDIKSKLDFNEILPQVGVNKIFNEPATGIVRDAAVKVSKVFQEAFIKVDEEGATAGAFTGMVAVPTSSFYEPPPPVKFTVDHPFLYAILLEDKIVFAGTYSA